MRAATLHHHGVESEADDCLTACDLLGRTTFNILEEGRGGRSQNKRCFFFCLFLMFSLLPFFISQSKGRSIKWKDSVRLFSHSHGEAKTRIKLHLQNKRHHPVVLGQVCLWVFPDDCRRHHPLPWSAANIVIVPLYLWHVYSSWWIQLHTFRGIYCRVAKPSRGQC